MIQSRDIKVNRKRVAKLMRKAGLFAKSARKHYINYAKKNKHEEKANLLNQVFKTDYPNKVWVGDITYIPTLEGTLYLSVFLDLYSRKVVGWSMSKRMKDDITIEAFLHAYGREKPCKGFIVHTDQGSQYTSKAFRTLIESYGGMTSNSRKGTPYDNAIMDSFYRTLKRELINDSRYANRGVCQEKCVSN